MPADPNARIPRWPPDFDPVIATRENPQPVPNTAIDDGPYACAKINFKWVGHIIGALESLLASGAWDGPESEQERAFQEIESLMAQLKEPCTLQPITVEGDIVPVGTIIDYVGSTPPDGYLAMNGQIVSQTNYPELAAVVPYSWYFIGSNPPVFRLPDMRGDMVASGYSSPGQVYPNDSTYNLTLSSSNIPRLSVTIPNGESQMYVLGQHYGTSRTWRLQYSTTGVTGHHIYGPYSRTMYAGNTSPTPLNIDVRQKALRVNKCIKAVPTVIPGQDSVIGPKGEDGASAELRLSADGKAVEWRQDDGSPDWTVLFQIPEGTPGEDGSGVLMRYDSSDNFVQWRADDWSTGWTNLYAPQPGPPGPQGEPGAPGADGDCAPGDCADPPIQPDLPPGSTVTAKAKLCSGAGSLAEAFVHDINTFLDYIEALGDGIATVAPLFRAFPSAAVASGIWDVVGEGWFATIRAQMTPQWERDAQCIIYCCTLAERQFNRSAYDCIKSHWNLIDDLQQVAAVVDPDTVLSYILLLTSIGDSYDHMAREFNAGAVNEDNYCEQFCECASCGPCDSGELMEFDFLLDPAWNKNLNPTIDGDLHVWTLPQESEIIIVAPQDICVHRIDINQLMGTSTANSVTHVRLEVGSFEHTFDFGGINQQHEHIVIPAEQRPVGRIFRLVSVVANGDSKFRLVQGSQTKITGCFV